MGIEPLRPLTPEHYQLCEDTPSKSALQCFIQKASQIFILKKKAATLSTECSAKDLALLEVSMDIKRDSSVSPGSPGAKEREKEKDKGIAKKEATVDSRLFLPMYRVTSQVENDALLVKSLQSLSYVRGNAMKERKSLQNKKQKRSEDLELNTLAQEIITFVTVVTEEGDLKAYLVLIKLLLCIWEETKDNGVEEFLLYMQTSTLTSLGWSTIPRKEILRQRLASVREKQRLTSLLNNPRVLVCKGRPSKTMALEVQGEVACGIIGGVCVKPLHESFAYFEATLKGSALGGILLGWKVCGSDPFASSVNTFFTSTSTTDDDAAENDQSGGAGLVHEATTAVQRDKSLQTAKTCWVLDGANRRFYHACRPTPVNETQTKAMADTETASVDSGFAFLSSLGGIIDETDDRSRMGSSSSGEMSETFGSDDEEEKNVVEAMKMEYKGIELTIASSDSVLEWKAGTTVGCLLDTRTGRLRFAVDGHILGACDSTLDAAMHLGENFSEVGVCPVFSCSKNAGLEFNVGQAPFKHLSAFQVEASQQELASVSQHRRPCYLRLNSTRDHPASSTTSPALAAVPVQGQGIFVEGFRSSKLTLSQGLTVEACVRLAESDFWDRPKSSSIEERYLWSASVGDRNGSNVSSTLSLSVDSLGHLRVSVRQGVVVTSPAHVIRARTWHSISVVIKPAPTDDDAIKNSGNRAGERGSERKHKEKDKTKGGSKRHKGKGSGEDEDEKQLTPRSGNVTCRVLVVVDKEIVVDADVALNGADSASTGGSEKCPATFYTSPVIGVSVGAAISPLADSKCSSPPRRMGSKKRSKQDRNKDKDKDKDKDKEMEVEPSFRLLASPRSASRGCGLDVCEFRLWCSPLSLSSVLSSQGRGALLGAETSLLVYLSFEEGGGANLHDRVCARKSNVMSKGDKNAPGASKRIDYPSSVHGSYTWRLLSAAGEQASVVDDCPSALLGDLVGTSSGTGLQELLSVAKDALEVIKPGQDNYLHVSLPQVLAVVINRFATSMDAWDDIAPNPVSWCRHIQERLPSADEVRQPSILVFLMLQSILAQAVRLGRDDRKGQDSRVTKTVHALCATLIKLVHINIRAVLTSGMSLAACGMQYNRQSDAKGKKPLVSKLLVLLLHFVSSVDPLCRLEAAACIASGLSVFMPHPSDQAHLLECLLTKRLNGGAEKSSPSEMNLSSSPFSALCALSTGGEKALLKALLQRFAVPAHAAELVPHSMRPLMKNSLSLQSPDFTDAEFEQIEGDVHEVLDEGTPPQREAEHTSERLVPVTWELADSPHPGLLVCRGPDWVYDDQDGGKGRVGVVLEVSDWLGSPARCLRVQWPHGVTNHYRWNVESSPTQPAAEAAVALGHGVGGDPHAGNTPSLDQRRNLYDVCVLRPASELKSVSGEVSLLEGGSISRELEQRRGDRRDPPVLDRTEEQNGLPSSSLSVGIRSHSGNEDGNVAMIDSSDRLVLEYTPEEVYQSLVQEAGPLTKRGILSYMKSIAPMDWQQLHRLTWSINSLVKSLSSQETADLYIAFFSEFSSKVAPSQHVRGGSGEGQEQGGTGQDGDHQSSQLQDLMALLVVLVEKSDNIQNIFSVSSASSTSGDDDDYGHASLQILMTLQTVITGDSDCVLVGKDMSPESSHNPISMDTVALEARKHGSIFTGPTFTYNDGEKPENQGRMQWDWVRGKYDTAHTRAITSPTESNSEMHAEVATSLSTDTVFLSNDEEGVEGDPFLYTGDRTVAYTLAEAWSSLLLTAPCHPDSGLHRWAFRVSPNCGAHNAQGSFLRFHCGLTSDPALRSRANLSEDKGSWCVSADGDVFVRGEQLMNRALHCLPPMDPRIPTLDDATASSSKEDDKQGIRYDGSHRFTALQVARDHGCDVIVDFLFDSSRGVLLCRFGAEQQHRPPAPVAAGADGTKTSARASYSEEWQVVCTGLESMVLYPAVSVHSSEVRVELVPQPMTSSASVESAVEKAALAVAAAGATAAAPSKGAIRDRLQDMPGKVPPNLSHAFARSFAALIRTNARSAGIRNKSDGSSRISGSSVTSHTVLGLCPVGAPSSLLVGYALKLATTVTDMLSCESGAQATHPLVGHLLMHLVVSLVKYQHVCESFAPTLVTSFKALQATIGRLAVRLSSGPDPDVSIQGPRAVLNMLGYATSALLGRFMAGWVSFQGGRFAADNRILIEECRLSPSSDTCLGCPPVAQATSGVHWTADDLFSGGLHSAADKAKITKEVEYIQAHGQAMFAWLAASEKRGPGSEVGRRVGGPDMNLAVVSMFSAALHHIGKLGEVADLVNEHNNIPFKGSPPSYLSHCWGVCNSLRIQARRLRSSSELSYHALARVYSARAGFLLEIRACTDARTSRPDAEQEAVMSAVKSIYTFVTDAHSAASSVPYVKSALKTTDLHALYRCEGIKGLHQLLVEASSEASMVARSALLLHFPRALRGRDGNSLYRGRADNMSSPIDAGGDDGDSCHYLWGLHSCSPEEKSKLNAAYEALFSYLTSELRSVGTVGAGDTLEEVSYKLTLLDCLGVRVKERDHALFTRVRIFDVIQEMLEASLLDQVASSSDVESADEDSSSSPPAADGPPGKLSAGARVMGNYRGRGTWYAGTIKTAYAYGGYDILYDDNDVETLVPPDCIRCRDESLTLWAHGAHYDNSEASARGARGVTASRMEPGDSSSTLSPRQFVPAASRTNHAVMKVFTLLALQVASSMEKMSVSTREPFFADMQATVGIEMARTSTGPLTLGKSVLDIIYVQLLTIAKALAGMISSAERKERSNKDMASTSLGGETRGNESACVGPADITCVKVPDDVLAILCEACALLAALSGHPQCKALLCRPKWVALLMMMTVTCPRKCREHSLRILQEVLPLTAPGELNDHDQVFAPLESAITGRVPFAGADRISVTIVKLLLVYIGEYSLSSLELDQEASTSKQTVSLVLESSDEVAETYAGECSAIAESVALVRALGISEKWSSVVQEVLKDGLQDMTAQANSRLTSTPTVESEPSLARVSSRSGKEKEGSSHDNTSPASPAVQLGLLGVLGGLWEGFYVNGYVLLRNQSGIGAEGGASSPLGASPATRKNSSSPFHVLKSFDSADTFQYETVGVDGEVLQEGLTCSIDAAEPVSRFPLVDMRISADVVHALLAFCGTILRVDPVYSPLTNTESSKGRSEDQAIASTGRNLVTLLSCLGCRALTCTLSVPSAADAALDILTDASSDGLLVITLMRAAAAVSSSGGLMDIPVYENYSGLLVKMLRKAMLRDTLSKGVSGTKDADIADDKKKVEYDRANEAPRGGLSPHSAGSEQGGTESEEILAAVSSHARRAAQGHAGFLADPEMAELVNSLADMGFPRPWCEIALQMCEGDPDDALNYILSNGDQLEDMVNQELAGAVNDGAPGAGGGGFNALMDDGDDDDEDDDDEVDERESEGEQSDNDGTLDGERRSREGVQAPGDDVREVDGINNSSPVAGGSPQEEAATAIADVRIDATSPRVFHYATNQTTFLPFHAGPSLDSDRLGGLFPGDDITVIGRSVEELADGGSQVWLEMRLDFFDGHFYDDDENSSEDDDGDNYDRDRDFDTFDRENDSAIPDAVWVPALDLRNRSHVWIIEGPNQGNGSMRDLDDPPCPVFPVEATYRIAGGKGAIVRETPELTSSQVTSLQTGTVVRVVSETLNSDAKMRMRITSPVQGWITKLNSLVERMSGVVTGSGNTSNSQRIEAGGSSDALSLEPSCDWRALEEIDDELEHWGGGEIFRREDRLFGSLQGAQYLQRFHRAAGPGSESDCDGGNSNVTYNRRLRITAATSYTAAESNCATMSSTQLSEMLHTNCRTLTILYARRTALSLVLRSLRGRSETQRSKGGDTPKLPPLFVAMIRGCKASLAITPSATPSPEAEHTMQKSTDSNAFESTVANQLNLKVPGMPSAASRLPNPVDPSPPAGISPPVDDEEPMARLYMPFLDQIKGATLTEGQRRGDFSTVITAIEKETAEKADTTSVTDMADGEDRPTPYELAQMLISFLNLSLFRGEPSYSTGLEPLSLTTADALSAQLGNISITLDMAIYPLLNTLLSQSDIPGLYVESSLSPSAAGPDNHPVAGNANSKEESFCAAFLHLLLNSLARNITLACSPAQVDHCWADSSYTDDQDIDCLTSANIHFAQWASKACLQRGAAPVTYAVFMAWTYSLRGPSMSLKEVGCNTLAPLLATIASSFRVNPHVHTETLLSSCLDLLPRERLHRIASKRLWFEMEDRPAFSRFLQALLHFVTEIEDCASLLHDDEVVGLELGPPIPLSRSVSLMSSNSDIGGPSPRTRRGVPFEADLGLTSRSNAIASHEAEEEGMREERSCVPPAPSLSPEIAAIFRARPLLSFPGDSAHVSTGHNKDLSGAWTIEMWIKRGPAVVTEEEREIPSTIAGLVKNESSGNTKKTNSVGPNEDRGDVRGEGTSGEEVQISTTASAPAPVKVKVKMVQPATLLSSQGGYVKILSGGRLFELSEQVDPLKYVNPVHEKAMCLSIGQHGSEEKILDFCVPEGEWVHLALSYRSTGSTVSLFANGQLVDQVHMRFNLPLTTIGSKRTASSLSGHIAEVRVWNTAKTSQELQRDMAIDMSGAKSLSAHLRCRERRGNRIFDSAGLLNNCKLHGVEWVKESGPCMQKNPIPSFMISESEEIEGLTGDSIGASANVVEMTGVLRSDGLVSVGPTGGDAAVPFSEVVCFCFRETALADANMSSISPNSARSSGQREDRPIEGYLEWCARGVRSRLQGKLSRHGKLKFAIESGSVQGSGGSTISGSPESMQWLHGLQFEGEMKSEKLVGSLQYSTSMQCPPPVTSGQTRIDKYLVHNNCEYRVALSLAGTFVQKVAVRENTASGQFVTGVEVAPFCGSEGSTGDDGGVMTTQSSIISLSSQDETPPPSSRAVGSESEAAVARPTPPTPPASEAGGAEGAVPPETAVGEGELAPDLPRPPVLRDRSVEVQRSMSIGGSETTELKEKERSSVSRSAQNGALDYDKTQYGLIQGQGSIWVDFTLDSDVSGTISFGVSTAQALSHADSSVHVNEGTWCYSTSGEVSHAFDMTELEECDCAQAGDHVSILVDTGRGEVGGSVSFFVNEKEVAHFNEVNAHSHVNSISTMTMPIKERGIRPFFSLGSSGDRVTYNGYKQGFTTATWPADTDNASVSGFKRLECNVESGTWNGYGRLWLHDDQEPGYWYGLWKDGRRQGAHIWIPQDGYSSVEAAAAGSGSAENQEADLMMAHDRTVSAAITNPRRALLYESDEKENGAKGPSTGLSGQDLPLTDSRVLSVCSQWEAHSLDSFGHSKQHLSTSGVLGDDYASQVSAQNSPRERGNRSPVTFRIRDGSGSETHFKVTSTVKMTKAFEVYAQKRNLPVGSMRFILNGEPIDPEATPASLGLNDGDTVGVLGSVHESDSAALEKLLEESKAPYVIKIIYRDGATVRSGVEIEDNSTVRHLGCGEIVEAFGRAVTRDSIPRFQIVDGWISQHLRGGNNETVFTILRELPEVPISYRVIREGGAKLRSGEAADSADMGFVPTGTTLQVAERRLATIDGESTMRLRICDPEAYRGWISEKEHIVARANPYEDLEVVAELSRLSRLRQARATPSGASAQSEYAQSSLQHPSAGGQIGVAGKGTTKERVVRVCGSLDVSSDVLFLLNGRHRGSAATGAASDGGNGTNSNENNNSSHDESGPPGAESIEISPDYCTALCQSSYDGRYGRPMVLGSRGFTRGRHYWEVTINKAEWGCVFIGVCPQDASGWMGYGLLNYRATQAFGAESLYGKYLSAGDTVGVLLDLDHGTISFYKDGDDFTLGKHSVVDMGVAYHNLRRSNGTRNPTLFPCFGLKHPSDSVTIKSCRWLSVRGLSPGGHLKRLLLARKIVKRWSSLYATNDKQDEGAQELVLSSSSSSVSSIEQRTGLPEDLLRTFHRAYQIWLSREKLVLRARPGMNVECDCSMESVRLTAGPEMCDAHTLRPGRPFQNNRYGSGKIVGTQNNCRIWYSIDSGECDAWYWTKTELEELVSSGVVAFESEDNNSDKEQSGESVHRAQKEGCDATTAASREQGQHERTRDDSQAPFDSFVAMFSHSTDAPPSCPRVWSRAEDEAMVLLVNAFSSRFSADPLRIESGQLVSFWRATPARAARPDATQADEAGSGDSAAIMGARECLAPRTDEEIEVRYAALCVLNKALAIALPLADFSLATTTINPVITHFELALVDAVGRGEGVWGREERGVESTNQCDSDWETLLRQYYSPSSRTVLSLKRVTFSGVKRSYWDLTIQETTTNTPAPPDEYERPSAIPEVEVNRILAKDAMSRKDALDPEECLQRSVFGQLKARMAGWDGRQLRRSYISMEDAGQPRAFFVKFAGEGVDDHGGPYRAAFQTALAEEAGGLLDLFVPCPNGRSDDFDNRDLVVFNPQYVAPTTGVGMPGPKREDYVFLGKLVSTAVRHHVQVPLNLPSSMWKALTCEPVNESDLRAIDTHTSNMLQMLRLSSARGQDDSISSSSHIDRELLEQMLLGLRQEGLPNVDDGIVNALLDAVAILSTEGEESERPSATAAAYIAGLLTHLHLSSQQQGLALLHRGLFASAPVEILPIFTPLELEELFCGTQSVDLEVLKQATEYEDGIGPEDTHVRYFWAALEALNNEEKAAFVNFCSGRSRLPASAAQFPMTFKLQTPNPRSRDQPDKYLPIAQTCFFSLSLPKYSSQEIMLEKLRYAITNTELMDADVYLRHADGWQGI